MATTTTMGVKLDEPTRERLKQAAQKLDRTPHWLLRQAVFNLLESLESGNSPWLNSEDNAGQEAFADANSREENHQPFLDFAEQILPQSVTRSAITAAWRRPETDAVPMILEQARLTPLLAEKTHQLAHRLASNLREQKAAGGRSGMVQGLLQEFSLSSQEGVALMCLAEALLRIPDKPTRDALIRDKISHGNWQSHLGRSTSVFVNAATWGLLVTGKLVATHNEDSLSRSLNRLISKSGEPVVRKGVDMAMRLMGEQFVTGESIAEALANARRLEDKGFRYSYDMLGEAALTQKDADIYLKSYQQAIHAIGKASNGRGIYEGPGISIKLSALHPRYQRAHYDRVMDELYPTLKSLTLLARDYDIGINIDAEEADRLELSLDLLERLCFEPELEGWNGIGFVIQAYQKRCPFVIDYLIDLAQRSRRRLMIRLVKGAYWDSEIKRAQTDGLEGYPVYTRKVYTDVSYLACARKLLSVPNLIYPQFATHNAQSLAAIYQLAGNNYYPGQYEFQCLHGMGEPLYEQVVGPLSEGKLNRPCRIYAPVGTHETLLAYLVRRLLENGANTSFVNRIADKTLSLEDLIIDPVAATEALAAAEGITGMPHPAIPLPRTLYGENRQNSVGLDLANEHRLASLSSALLNSASQSPHAAPMIDAPACPLDEKAVAVQNPADTHDIVGTVRHASLQEVDAALEASTRACSIWFATPAHERAAILDNAAVYMESQLQPLIGILVREAGKSYANAIAEVREAVDFLRYYAASVRDSFDNETHRPLGPVVCISPWNFPLAIFTGQIAAALAAGNAVLAKPAEQTPLIAMRAVEIMHEAGVPRGVLQLLPGRGETVGAALVASSAIRGVIFTGSTAVASLLQRNIAGRLDPAGQPIPLIAETGGMNAMIVDSSALTEQVVSDVIASAFDSAGQRCSALRLLCLQEDIADHTLEMLRGAMAEYCTGNPEYLNTDIGPVIDEDARQMIEQHIATMTDQGFHVSRITRGGGTAALKHGHFVVPALIEIDSASDLRQEIFGPVLHVVRYHRNGLVALINEINSAGYGLTFGVHSRIDETINKVTAGIDAGNLYVNRNMVGAVVGVQPFGGEGLSGTGPKAGGPLYLYRLLSSRPQNAITQTLSQLPDTKQDKPLTAPFVALSAWAESKQMMALSTQCQQFAEHNPSHSVKLLVGPTGERNSYALLPRERVLCLADNMQDAFCQLAAVTCTGCRILWPEDALHRQWSAQLPPLVAAEIDFSDTPFEASFDAVIFHGDADQLSEVCQHVALRNGPIVSVQGFSRGESDLLTERLLLERSISVNTAAAGGNASLMTLG